MECVGGVQRDVDVGCVVGERAVERGGAVEEGEVWMRECEREREMQGMERYACVQAEEEKEEQGGEGPHFLDAGGRTGEGGARVLSGCGRVGSRSRRLCRGVHRWTVLWVHLCAALSGYFVSYKKGVCF